MFFRGVIYTQNRDFEAWCTLFDDFRDKIGLDPDFVDYIDNIHLLNSVMEKYHASSVLREGIYIRDRFILNEIERIEIEIKNFEKMNDGKQQTITQVLVSLWKGEKLHIRRDDLTVLEYFMLIKSYSTDKKAS